MHLLKIIKISNPIICPYSLEFYWSTSSVSAEVTGREHVSGHMVFCWPADVHQENSVDYQELSEIFAEAYEADGNNIVLAGNNNMLGQNDQIILKQ